MVTVAIYSKSVRDLVQWSLRLTTVTINIIIALNYMIIGVQDHGKLPQNY